MRANGAANVRGVTAEANAQSRRSPQNRPQDGEPTSKRPDHALEAEPDDIKPPSSPSQIALIEPSSLARCAVVMRSSDSIVVVIAPLLRRRGMRRLPAAHHLGPLPGHLDLGRNRQSWPKTRDRRRDRVHFWRTQRTRLDLTWTIEHRESPPPSQQWRT